MNILAIDDEKLALASLVETIKEALPEATIYNYRDPLIAFQELDNVQIDIAFLDIRMKGLNGIDVATKLQENNPKINIIFTTGYSNYQDQAFKMHASGYLRKPITKEDILEEVNHLRYDVKDIPNCFIETFGNFNLYVGGKLVKFKRKLSKEMFAYLVDKRGTSVNRQELSLVLFNEITYTRKDQDYLSKIIKSLKETLKENHIEDILIQQYNSYYIDVSKVVCDVYEYLSGNPKYEFNGQYMSEFIWGEDAALKLYKN